MADPTTTQDPVQTIHHSHRFKRLGAVAVVLLVLLAITGIWLQRISHTRYKVVGRTDPNTGYRIEYTVSSRYKKSREVMVPKRPEFGQNNVFRPKPLPRAVQWAIEHIPGRSKPPRFLGPPGWQPGTIEQQNADGITCYGVGMDAQGYPDVSYLRRFAADIVMKHAIISGCRATWCAFSPRGMLNPRPRCYWLLIQAKDHTTTNMYSFMALDNDADRTGVENELMKIRDSIRIVKAK